MLALVGDQTGDVFDVTKVFPIAYFISSEEEALSYGIANGAGQYITREKDLGVFAGTNKQCEAEEVDEGGEALRSPEEGAVTA